MRSFFLFFILLLFITSVYLNCSLYGAIARIPHYGISVTEYAERERDIFLIMYITGGSLLPPNEKIKDWAITLARRADKKAIIAPRQTGSIGPYPIKKTFDLASVLIHILYWIPPVSLVSLLLVLLMPKTAGEEV